MSELLWEWRTSVVRRAEAAGWDSANGGLCDWFEKLEAEVKQADALTVKVDSLAKKYRKERNELAKAIIEATPVSVHQHSARYAIPISIARRYLEDAEPKCTRCQGHGKIVENFCTDYEAASRRECPCYVKCYTCYGTGKRKETKMDFQKALTELKSGAKISREGWNGKEMWLALQKGYPEGIGINKNTAAATGLSVGTICKFLPYIMMKTAQREFVPWLASQTDILADDWGVVK